MALLGQDHISKRINEDKLLENLGDRDLNNPEGVGRDLRLGAIFKISEGGAFIESDGAAGQGKRKGVKTETLAEFKQSLPSEDGKPDSDAQEDVVIKPGEYYLVQTVESVNTPQDLMPMIYPRTSLFRAGLVLINSKIDPGYNGVITMGLTNLSPFDVTLQMGARICNMVFYKIEGETVNYRGQHQGGRVTPEEEEQQV